MNKFKISVLFLLVTGCGFSSSQNEASGQVKKVLTVTPIVCPAYTEIDLSLGVMRNGQGSISKEDLVLALDNSERETIGRLKVAAETGAIARLVYDVKRVSWCWPDHRLVSVVIDRLPPSPAVEVTK